jgi:hypothetical protein
MSAGQSADRPPLTDFDRWLAEEFASGTPDGFTVLMLVLKIRKKDVKPLASAFAHVIGDEIDWGGMTAILNGSGRKWDAAVFFPRRDPKGGPLDNSSAKIWLMELQARIDDDRLVINEGRFFDAWGRAMRVDEASP